MLIENALATYYGDIQHALRDLFATTPETTPDTGGDFTPGTELPHLSAAMRDFLAPSGLAHAPMGHYAGKQLALLDLTRNPATGTTKTYPSLVIVARAIRFIQDTGQRVTIVTPSSANKAIALRDAVLRAITCGLVGADQLNVITVVPAASVPKLRSSELFTDPALRARNPIAVHHGPTPGAVKTIARALVDDHRTPIEQATKTNLWYTLQLENYLAADTVRALAEHQHFPPAPDRPRLHVHAVSSAYGLLGHAYGRTLLDPTARAATPEPHYLLVQHLGAPDMVLSLYHHGVVDPAHAPTYTRDPATGLYTQHTDPHFPTHTFDPHEDLDPTFYTRNPPTSARMNHLIHTQGGGGIVVSLAECLQRYAQARDLLARAAIDLPANPTAVREWSLVMAVVGLLNAVDRGLVPEGDILIHASGHYHADQVGQLSARDLHDTPDTEALRRLVLGACAQ